MREIFVREIVVKKNFRTKVSPRESFPSRKFPLTKVSPHESFPSQKFPLTLAKIFLDCETRQATAWFGH